MVPGHAGDPETSDIPVCGIGASAGGIEALREFFEAIPVDLGMAYVVIVHLAPDRPSELPDILTRWTTMPVLQVGDHDKVKLRPDTVYVIAPDRKLELTDSSIGASRFDQPRGQRAAIDLFLRSLAEHAGTAYAVILSGSGSDGAMGSRAVKGGGGVVLVQSPDDAAHGDMPTAVIATGAADVVLPVRQLADRLAELSRHRDELRAVLAGTASPGEIREADDHAIGRILEIVRRRTGHDFHRYKRNTILRRLSRRMQLNHLSSVNEYHDHLLRDSAELQALFDDFLITVTAFFRDPASWEVLRDKVVIPLVERTETGEQLRIWVAGCATGEEAYAMAILFCEVFDARGRQPNFIVFASDIDENALAIAREGRYPQAIGADLTPERLASHFRQEGNHYRVLPAIRDHVVFATHGLLRDPPFSRLHLVSCRNLLIYLDRGSQEQAMAVFRYACRDHGYLFLGASEQAAVEAFHPVDVHHRIFEVESLADGERPPLPESLVLPGLPGRRHAPPPGSATANSGRDLHLAALETAAPPSLVVDERYNVAHLSASASRFLLQGGGPPTPRVTDLVRPELRDELQALLHRAFDAPESRLSAFVAVRFNGSVRRVAMLAQRHAPTGDVHRHVLVTFLDAGPAPEPTDDPTSSDEQVRTLREQLRDTERRLDEMRDVSYLTTEDLRAANEELQSLNEEYRSTTEELETSREELQSMNEELQTVNQELKLKLEEVSTTNADLENLMVATEVATLFLDAELRITRFTPTLTTLFNIRTRDIGRPVGDITHQLDYPQLETDARRVLSDAAAVERDVTSRDGRTVVARVSPYRRARENRSAVDGVVLTFVDVTQVLLTKAELLESQQRLSSELEGMRRLHDLTMAVISAPTLQEAIEQSLGAAVSLMNADHGVLHLLGPDRQRVQLLAHARLTPAFLETFATIAADDPGAIARVLRTEAPVAIGDVRADPDYPTIRKVVDGVGYLAVLAQPLIAKNGEFVGVLTLMYRGPREFSERDHQLGALVGRQAADLVVSRYQQDQLTRVATALQRRTEELEVNEARLSTQAALLLEQDRNKELFLATLSHELRNPMAALSSGLELLVRRNPGRDDAAFEMLRRQMRHLARLVNDLLDVSRINSGKLRLEPAIVDLGAVVESAADAARGRFEARHLALLVKLPRDSVLVEGDAERLTQVLDNLLGNALAYTDTGTVTVTVAAGSGMARVQVQDTGIGVEPAVAHRLFEMFYQRHDTDRHGGLGLGLSLSRRLVEMHGGELTLSSEGTGTGTTVEFTVPLARRGARVVPPSRIPQAPRRRVLVVDDHRDAADAFGGVLEAMGQEVRVTYDGPTAIEVATEFRPAVAFVDLSMPVMSGGEVARALRQRFSEAELALIAVSGHRADSDVAAGGAFHAHLLKPASAEAILRLLNELPTG